MADLILKPSHPQQRGSDMNPVQPNEDSLAHLDLPPSKLRQRRAIPRIASLDVLNSSRMGGSACPSIRSDSSQSPSHQLSLSPVEPTEVVWYQDRDQTEAPMSLNQMVDALHYIMMTKPVLDPVPREYNSYILHLLEGYWNVQEQLKKTEQALAEETETKQRSLEEFAKMSDEWQEKETAFRAEIKRMELVLAKVAPEGVGAVVLARSESVVDRSTRSSRIFKAKIERARGSPDKDGYDPYDADRMEDSHGPNGSGSPRRTHRTLLSMQPSLDDNADVELSQELRKAQRKRHWAINDGRQHMPPNPADIGRALDTISSDEDATLRTIQWTSDSSARPRAAQLSRRSSRVQTGGASHATKPAIDMSEEYGDSSQPSSNSSREILSVSSMKDGAVVADITAGERSSRGRLGVMAAAFGKPTEPSVSKTSEIYRHRREFSFKTGEDGIPLQTFGAAVESANGQDAHMHLTESSTIGHISERTASSSSGRSNSQLTELDDSWDTQAQPCGSQRKPPSTSQ
ncbi:hypothetical protein CI238_02499 [Colletotrichum incanum]|uniref:Uncharacterized protein n=1 Tax=Colletotrichum incanum TaxID=1573173 RepID=A0A161Y252_COLIC|nr:hypothetical protein CI238_02499 [Colletotrichum incanum]